MKNFLQSISVRKDLPFGKKNGQTAAIMIVRIPGLAEDNLGEYLKISREEMKRVAHLEIAVVVPEYQGYGLQYELFCQSEAIVKISR